MNNRDQAQFPTERFRSFDDAGEAGGDGIEHRDEYKAVTHIFSFASFRVVPHARRLERAGSSVALSSRAFDILCLLISRPGEIVSKAELMAKAWPDVTVEESSLRFHITQLRRTLGEGHGGGRYVVNVPGRGYCFVACVNREASLRQRDGNATIRHYLADRLPTAN